MLPVKFNFKNDKKNQQELWRSDSFLVEIESQSHILHCPAYQQLRENKSLENQDDLIS